MNASVIEKPSHAEESVTPESVAPDTVSPGALVPYWSASRLKMLLQCPRQFRYRYLDAIPALATAPIVFGKTLHEVLRVAGERHMASGELPVVAEMLLHLARAWNAALEEHQPLFGTGHPSGPSHHSHDDYLLLGGAMLERFYERFAHQPPPLAVELAFEIPWGESSLLGFIDRVDEVGTDEAPNGLVVVDYKSGARKPSPRQASEDLQLTVYALAARQVLGQSVSRVEFHCLRDGTSVGSTRDEATVQAQMHQVWNSVQQCTQRGEFPPCPGYYCRFCDYRELCQAEGFVADGRRPRGECDGPCR